MECRHMTVIHVSAPRGRLLGGYFINMVTFFSLDLKVKSREIGRCEYCYYILRQQEDLAEVKIGYLYM